MEVGQLLQLLLPRVHVLRGEAAVGVVVEAGRVSIQFLSIINRPGVAGAVLQSPPSLIYSLTAPLVPICSYTVIPKPSELES